MEFTNELVATITDIQKFSVHDGPGIRTVVFFKGCPLRCQWCQNPETWSAQPEMMYTASACIRCGACEITCTQKAVQLTINGVAIDKSKCIACGTCVKTCFAEARKKVGKVMNVDEVLSIILQDVSFYQENGGVTLSGGEVLLYADFAAELLKRAKENHIHTAIETCGFADWTSFQKILPFVDLVLFDVKHTDNDIHKKYTGQGNDLILENLKRITELSKDVIIRVPYIPGVNDSDENIKRTGELALQLNVKMIHLLPFHQMGQGKWHGLGREYSFECNALPDPERVEQSKKLLEDLGVEANVGGYKY